MRRILIAILLVLHGLAHSAAGVWAMSLGPAWAVVPLWLVAEAGFVAAGLGLAGVPWLRGHWQPIAFFAGVSSVALLASFGTLPLVAGLLFDVLLLVLATAVAERSVELEAGIEPRLPNVRRHRGAIAAAAVAWMFLGWLALVIVSRPWYTAWGVNEAERMMTLPGDELVPVAHYRMDRAVTVQAPADSVWPWLVQIGQDRGGFYGRAAQPGYLGGTRGNALGWHVVELRPGRALVLEDWGAVVVQPLGANSSRLHVRTRGAGNPSLAGVALGPVSLLVYEPAHFIMQRRMLLGIRDRAEGRIQAVGFSPPSA